VSKAQLHESVKIFHLRLSVVDAIRVHGLDRDSGLAKTKAAERQSILPFAKPPLDILSRASQRERNELTLRNPMIARQ
jgi:hypothetical protein